MCNVLSDIEIAQSMLAKGEGSEQGQQKQVRPWYCVVNVWTVLNALPPHLLAGFYTTRQEIRVVWPKTAFIEAHTALSMFMHDCCRSTRQTRTTGCWTRTCSCWAAPTPSCPSFSSTLRRQLAGGRSSSQTSGGCAHASIALPGLRHGRGVLTMTAELFPTCEVDFVARSSRNTPAHKLHDIGSGAAERGGAALSAAHRAGQPAAAVARHQRCSGRGGAQDRAAYHAPLWRPRG